MIHLNKFLLSSYCLSLGLLLTIPSSVTDSTIGVAANGVSVRGFPAATWELSNLDFWIENARADDDDDEEDEEEEENVPPVNHSAYSDACGACHFAYQPGLLPARSWEELMTTLNDHFGDNAEMAMEDQQTLTDYLVQNASNRYQRRRGSPSQEVYLRISELPSIVHAHHELSKKQVEGNPQVRSISHCEKCHTKASKGSYSEDEVDIPGFGRRD